MTVFKLPHQVTEKLLTFVKHSIVLYYGSKAPHQGSTLQIPIASKQLHGNMLLAVDGTLDPCCYTSQSASRALKKTQEIAYKYCSVPFNV